jgi:hypothetical protein
VVSITPQKRFTYGERTALYRRLGGSPEPVWTQRLEEKSFASVGDGTPVVQSVVKTLY